MSLIESNKCNVLHYSFGNVNHLEASSSGMKLQEQHILFLSTDRWKRSSILLIGHYGASSGWSNC